MGYTYTAKCECGYEVTIYFGSGFRQSWPNFDSYPYHCKTCKSLVIENPSASRPRCSECGSSALLPYDNPDVPHACDPASNPSSAEVGTTRELTDGLYFCPKCCQISLKFIDDFTFWD